MKRLISCVRNCPTNVHPIPEHVLLLLTSRTRPFGRARAMRLRYDSRNYVKSLRFATLCLSTGSFSQATRAAPKCNRMIRFANSSPLKRAKIRDSGCRFRTSWQTDPTSRSRRPTTPLYGSDSGPRTEALTEVSAGRGAKRHAGNRCFRKSLHVPGPY